MDRSLIEKIGKTTEDRMLLAKVFDKINSGIRKNIPSSTAFLPGKGECIFLHDSVFILQIKFHLYSLILIDIDTFYQAD